MPIHYISARTRKPFVPVNCGAIPENLFENELFGHVKGTFTDANFQQIGLVKEAEGGTLLLDEIGTVSPYIQIKLLRLLQEFWGQLSLIIHLTTASTRFANDFSGTPLHATIQTKLAISIPENRFEREADRVADHVVCLRKSRLQRACACGERAAPKCQTGNALLAHELTHVVQQDGR